MKSVSLSLAVVLLTLASWAQNAPSTPTPAQTPPAPMHHHGMQAMPPEHMQQMKAQVEKMSATVAQMKTNLAKIKDPAAKQQAQLDADLWDGMVKHMQAMVDMMSQHQESGAMHGMGMMDHDGMATMQGGCCAGMKEGSGCCGDMKDDIKAGGCCGGGKCMKPNSGSAPSGASN